MMTFQQYILNKIAEECMEVAHRALKSVRFGLGEVQPGQTHDNATRLMDEFSDLFYAMGELRKVYDLEAAIENLPDNIEDLKEAKFKKYLDDARSHGMVEPAP